MSLKQSFNLFQVKYSLITVEKSPIQCEQWGLQIACFVSPTVQNRKINFDTKLRKAA